MARPFGPNRAAKSAHSTPLRQYYGALCLLAANFAVLRCHRSAIPLFVPCSSPPARDGSVDQPDSARTHTV
jgi:hypothetical protein